ncbi:MAG: LUD domain-containing protein [Actinomycetota bacterium]|nr:LUD domain-containing protein [Actinomycetota bacterium]
MSAREEILERIRAGLTDRPVAAPILRTYRGPRGAGNLDEFVGRLEDYSATVHRSNEVATAITVILAGRGFSRVVVPAGFPVEWLPEIPIEVVPEPASVDSLDAVSAVVTTCAVAIAETGTIVLDAGPGMGARALTLIPDYHLVVVRAAQVLAIVPDAIAALDPTRPLTWISGPSATSDIELKRVEGVHGPRTLDVLLCDA